MAEDLSRPFPASIQYKAISRTHCDYNAQYWDRLKAFYAGGNCLLNSPLVMEVFPRHLNERLEVYQERLNRSFYINYAGEIIDHIVSALLMHPVQITSEGATDEFYKLFAEDVSIGGGRSLSVHQLVRNQVLSALICKRAWTLVDFPPVAEAFGEDLTIADQEQLGSLDAYAITLDPSMVLDWEETADGVLLWAKTCIDKHERSFDSVSNTVTREFTIYRPMDWARYSITFAEDKPPQPTDEATLIDSGPHSFGQVPLIRLEVPDGLWAMNKLESLCREYFNKRCALSWAEFKTLFQQLYEFEGDGGDCLEGEGPGNDPNRFTNQTRGPGYVQVRGQGDRAEYVGPSAEPFTHALNSLKDLRDEMHRVTHQMALSYDNHALALRRSGDSKHQDKKDSTIILDALGQLAREHVKEIFTAVARGRGDNMTFVVGGLDEYDSVDISGAIDEASRLQTIQLPSPTFRSEYAYSLVKTVLGEEVSVDVLEKIKAELVTGFEKLPQEQQPGVTPAAQSTQQTVDEENDNGSDGTDTESEQ